MTFRTALPMATVTLLAEPPKGNEAVAIRLSLRRSDQERQPAHRDPPKLDVAAVLQQVGPAVAKGRNVQRLVVHAHTPVDLISTWSRPSPSGSGTMAPVLCEMCIAVMTSSAFRPSRPVPTLSRSSMKHRTLSSAAP